MFKHEQERHFTIFFFLTETIFKKPSSNYIGFTSYISVVASVSQQSHISEEKNWMDGFRIHK